jgi:heme/copper-type cytochrome/quinol oxidase subunit 2
MTPILRIGVSIVLVALACYSAGVLSTQRRRAISALALRLLIAGVVFDVTATIFMIIGSGRVITLHGVIGYSALAAMLADTWLAWRHRRAFGDAPTPDWLHRYTKAAYAWWVVAFITGAALAAMSRASS